MKQENSVKETLAGYDQMPGRLANAIAGLSERELDLSYDADTWTIRQIIHHIVDGDDLTKNIVKAALGSSGCEYGLEWYDPNNSWAETLAYRDRDRAIEPALRLLEANHRHIQQLIKHIPDCGERYVLFKRYKEKEAEKVTAIRFLIGQTGHAMEHIEEILAIRERHKV